MAGGGGDTTGRQQHRRGELRGRAPVDVAVVDAMAAWTTTSTSQHVSDSLPGGAHRCALHVVYPPGLASAGPAPETIAQHDAVVGRHSAHGATVVWAAPSVSRRHLQLRWDEALGGHVAVDLGSHNGTRINGTRLAAGAPHPLRHGDVVRLGDVVAVWETAPADDSSHVDGAALHDLLPGASRQAIALRAAVARAATAATPVLVQGETGAGKEYVARALHAASHRGGPFVALNCGALATNLVESQLFGHETGAFTGATRRSAGVFEQASGGTLLLDEVGEMTLELQPKLLRVLQDGRVRPLGAAREVPTDVRVVAATNRDLALAVAQGSFRRDLWARLALLTIDVPPLRERRADILAWAQLLFAQWARGVPSLASVPARLPLSADGAEALVLAPWPENLRGLDACVRRYVLRSGAQTELAAADVATWAEPEARATAHERSLSSPVQVALPSPAATASRTPVPTREAFVTVLRAAGSVRAAAKALGRDRRQVYRWMQAWEVADAEWRPPADGACGDDNAA